MLNIAFKEWASVCHALAAGRQSIIIRKGGIAEENGEFVPEHRRFWLYPTQFHQRQQDGLKPIAHDLIFPDPVATHRMLELVHIAEVSQVAYVDTLDKAAALNDWHVWTPEMIEQRFHYKKPGFYLMVVRVYASEKVHLVEETPEYAGCKSWVTLNELLKDSPTTPVVSDSDWASFQSEFATVLTDAGITS